MRLSLSTVLVLATASCRSAPAAPVTPPVTPSSGAPLEAIGTSELCVGAGRVRGVGGQGERRLHIDAPGVRAFVAGDRSATAEIAFTYRGPSASTSPLASGELRRQVGLKLLAQDTCNVVYVMWHIEPSSGVFVSVKRNAGRTLHGECGAAGYDNVKAREQRAAPVILRDAAHVLRADLDGEELRVAADDIVVWRGRLPAQAFAFDGPVGLRTDNGVFDLQLRVPRGAAARASCPWP